MAPKLWGTALPDENAPRLPNLEPDQFWFILRAAGYEQPLLDWIEDMKLTAPVDWAQVSAKLQFAKFFERDHPLIEIARTSLGVSSEELDALWVYGGG